MKQELLNKEYSAEELCDIERDVAECYDKLTAEPDEYGFVPGNFKVVITYEEEQ